MKQLFFLLLIVITIFSSCDKGLIYNHSAKIINKEWKYDQVLKYDISTVDTSEYYELMVVIDHDKAFSYENFYILITTEFPDGTKMPDLVSIQLADKMGSWVSNCSGSSCSIELVLQDRFRFRQVGTHNIYIENYSREELAGIESIELKLYSINEM